MASRPAPSRPSEPPAGSADREARRQTVLRDLKLALVDQQVRADTGGFDPYNAQQGHARADHWDKRRRR